MGKDLIIIAKEALKELREAEYQFFQGYSPESAMKGAELIFRENKGFPRCTDTSKYKALLDMFVQGLNPLKKQCYFIPYRDELLLLRDYSGDIMVAKRSDERIMDIRAEVVRDGDLFDWEIVNGLKTIKRHKPTWESLNGKIIGTYAVAVDHDNNPLYVDLMSYDDYLNTLRKTNLKINGEPVVRQDGSIHPNSNHAKYPERMVRKTVIHRLCRGIIKASPNEKLQESFENTPEDKIEIMQADVKDSMASVPMDFTEEPEHEIRQIQVQEADPACSVEQRRRIVELETAANREKDASIENMSRFFTRQIESTRDLSEKEAEQYIEALLTWDDKFGPDPGSNEKIDPPVWGADL